jgi:hypothetical protein
VTGRWRKLHNEEHHNLYFSPSANRMKKPGRIRLVGHVARIGPKNIAYSFLVGKPD